MMRLAHEVAQNNVAVTYFSTMLPAQILANGDALSCFSSVHFLCLTCPPDLLSARLARRHGTDADASRLGIWVDFNAALKESATGPPTATVVDAGRPVDEVE